MQQPSFIPRLALAAGLSIAGILGARPSFAQESTPAAPGATSATPTPPSADPTLPQVDDPMLQPAPPASRVLRDWREATALLRRDSTAIRTTLARVQQSQAEARGALSAALPTVTAGAGIQHHLLRGEGFRFAPNAPPTVQTIPDPATTWNGNLNLRVPLLAPGAWYARGTALDAVDLSRIDAQEVARQQIALVATSIVSVVTAERLAEVSRVSLNSALSTLNLNRRRAELGASSVVDVLRTEQEVSASRSQVVSADEQLMRAREALGLALGSSDPWGVDPEIRLDSLAADAQASCTPTTDVRTRPDVRAARAALRISERNVNATRYDFWPVIDGVSNLTYYSTDNTPNGEHVTWTIGAVLSWPLYDGGERYAVRGARKAEAVVSRERLTDTERRARVEATQAVRGVRTAQANLVIARRSREIAAETARLARVAFLSGSGTSFDLVDTARQLREAEIDLAIQEFEAIRARIAALLALSTCRV